MASISILAVVLLFMFRVVEWHDLQERMEWGVILMYGGAIAISSILNSTGAGLWFAETYILPHLSTPWMLIVVLSLLTIILTEAMSNAAVVAVLLPIGMSVVKQFEVDRKSWCIPWPRPPAWRTLCHMAHPRWPLSIFRVTSS
jgi:sodium-dependent dicarboxylate transporter 2/3/5